jgi:hypothetical protein
MKKITFFCDEGLLDNLNLLSSTTRVDKSKYIREGIEMVLEKNTKEGIFMNIGQIPLRHCTKVYRSLIEAGRKHEAESFRKLVEKEIDSVRDSIKEVEEAAQR